MTITVINKLFKSCDVVVKENNKGFGRLTIPKTELIPLRLKRGNKKNVLNIIVTLHRLLFEEGAAAKGPLNAPQSS